jgi:hypothetical protein
LQKYLSHAQTLNTGIKSKDADVSKSSGGDSFLNLFESFFRKIIFAIHLDKDSRSAQASMHCLFEVGWKPQLLGGMAFSGVTAPFSLNLATTSVSF